MKKMFLTVTLTFLFCLQFFAQNTTFKATAATNTEKVERLHTPVNYKLFTINLNEIFEKVKNAPELTNSKSSVILRLPDAKGLFNSYYIYNNPNMEEALASQNPNIRSFKAIGVDNKMLMLDISISNIFGLHATGRNADGSTFYIDNYTKDFNTVIVYDRNSLEIPKTNFNCEVTSTTNIDTFDVTTNNQQTLSFDTNRRTYRLALACTIEYADFQIKQAPNSVPKITVDDKKNIVLAAMNVTLTRLNSIFERELNMHLNLVANNKDIIFITSDNFSNNNASLLISQSQSVISNSIGNANFDIGHTFSTGGGGLASFECVCDNNQKAEGITGSSSPVGDPYDVDYVAHEIGHQFGANHTFNNMCQFNINPFTAVETGSGSTIMSYAGICPPNVQDNVQDYYHYVSLKEMSKFLQTATCATQNTITNNAPTVTNLDSYNIPYGTPFILKATATDADNDPLTYTFEQIDIDRSTQPPAASSNKGPAFRSMAPSLNNYRILPELTNVHYGTHNANGVIMATWEQLATVARTYTFAGTVRDNNPLGGRVAFTNEFKINVQNTGPFVITYPNNNPSTKEPTWFLGTSKTITWNVAGTTANNINTTHVNILLSTDGGATYTTLVANTPNDGSETITIPTNISSTYTGRIKIEAVNNIYFTISKNLVIWDKTLSNQPKEIENLVVYPNPTTNVLNISFDKDALTKTTYSVYDLLGRLVFKHTSETTDKVETLKLQDLSSGTYVIIIENNNKATTTKFIKK